MRPTGAPRQQDDGQLRWPRIASTATTGRIGRREKVLSGEARRWPLLSETLCERSEAERIHEGHDEFGRQGSQALRRAVAHINIEESDGRGCAPFRPEED